MAVGLIVTLEAWSFCRPSASSHGEVPLKVFYNGADSRDESGRTRLDWNLWRGEQVLYRWLNPARVNWSQLPELLVLFEPMVGQRLHAAREILPS